MKELWFSRDLPVLQGIVEQFEIHDRPLLGLPRVAELTGFTLAEVGKACMNLEKAGYLELVRAMGGNDYSPWCVKEISASALVATGAWPSPESLSAAIVEELVRASEASDSGNQVGWLKKILSGAGEVSKEIFTRVITEAVVRVLTPGR